MRQIYHPSPPKRFFGWIFAVLFSLWPCALRRRFDSKPARLRDAISPYNLPIMSLLHALLLILPTGYILSSLLLLVGLALPAYRATFQRQLWVANLVMLLVSVGVVMSTAAVIFSSLSTRSEADSLFLLNRMAGPYWFFYWGSFFCKGVLPQLFWFGRLRRSPFVTTLVATGLMLDFCSFLFLNIGRDYLPSSWSMRPNYLALLTCALAYTGLLAAIAALRYWRTKAATMF
ncbi:hypothetical protein Q5H92_17005 [Hymenobacter sp. M29]|uniref:Uncharacterized protein n=1 Tax=Hymenobacter mellowenesis TaxID=3063995 RepID=A0ABT9ADY6_9BACT|nr:hypothetical protein [Hymenobacter sp. M29]MDO7848067.1 hypothetical protein [Hymenobacter sp. M29]